MSKGANVNINETIKAAAKETAKQVIEELKSNRFIKNDISYFRKVEILLYQYPSLKKSISQKEEDIKYIEQHGLPEKSCSIVMYQTSGGNRSGQDRYVELIEKYKAEKAETERDIQRIDTALNKVKDDKYYRIVELKYFENMKEEDIAAELEKDTSTVYRNKKRLINNLKTILFPESIKEFL